jgi:hypothetical protein
MIKCFEANYPESLGVVLIHRAPWIFQGIWKVIRGWLDPVVAQKVNFTSNKAELSEFIDPFQQMKELGGDEPFEYSYIEPVTGENDKMKDVTARDKIQSERDQLVSDYEASTLAWVDGDSKAKDKRKSIAGSLATNYWRLDPYIRARSLYDRLGIIGPGGKLDFYPEKPAAKNEADGKQDPVPTSDSKSEEDEDVFVEAPQVNGDVKSDPAVVNEKTEAAEKAEVNGAAHEAVPKPPEVAV